MHVQCVTTCTMHVQHPEKAPARKAGFETADHFWYNEINGLQQWEDPTLNRIDGEKMLNASMGWLNKERPTSVERSQE